jgi:hypothetical protein
MQRFCRDAPDKPRGHNLRASHLPEMRKCRSTFAFLSRGVGPSAKTPIVLTPWAEPRCSRGSFAVRCWELAVIRIERHALVRCDRRIGRAARSKICTEENASSHTCDKTTEPVWHHRFCYLSSDMEFNYSERAVDGRLARGGRSLTKNRSFLISPHSQRSCRYHDKHPQSLLREKAHAI